MKRLIFVVLGSAILAGTARSEEICYSLPISVVGLTYDAAWRELTASFFTPVTSFSGGCRGRPSALVTRQSPDFGEMACAEDGAQPTVFLECR